VLELPSRFHTSRQMKNSLVNRSAPRSAWPRGWRLEGAREVAYEVRFEGSRHEPANDDNAPEHGLGVRLTARW